MNTLININKLNSFINNIVEGMETFDEADFYTHVGNDMSNPFSLKASFKALYLNTDTVIIISEDEDALEAFGEEGFSTLLITNLELGLGKLESKEAWHIESRVTSELTKLNNKLDSIACSLGLPPLEAREMLRPEYFQKLFTITVTGNPCYWAEFDRQLTLIGYQFKTDSSIYLVSLNNHGGNFSTSSVVFFTRKEAEIYGKEVITQGAFIDFLVLTAVVGEV